jgi:tetratricopeptide (TPR) repeat protein
MIWLEEAHAESSPDVRLRFDLGEMYQDLEHYSKAIEVLEPALGMAPDHPAAAQAWSSIASAYAHLDRSAEEIAAYDAVLARTMNVAERANVLGNRAEAEMRLGHLEEAIAGYRDAIAVAGSVSGRTSLVASYVLAHWGLAVALDRSGDTSAGAREAELAVQLDPGRNWPKGTIIANDSGDPDLEVYFVPDYEVFYYLGLGMAEVAKQAGGPTAASLWGKTATMWATYISGAELWEQRHKDLHDRWMPRARVHFAKAERERSAAEKRSHAR